MAFYYAIRLLFVIREIVIGGVVPFCEVGDLGGIASPILVRNITDGRYRRSEMKDGRYASFAENASCGNRTVLFVGFNFGVSPLPSKWVSALAKPTC